MQWYPQEKKARAQSLSTPIDNLLNIKIIKFYTRITDKYICGITNLI